MKNIFTLVITLFFIQTMNAQLMITGAFDGTLSGGNPRGVELYVTNDISDLSDYTLEIYFNANTTLGSSFTFPAVGASAGDYIYVVKDATEFNTYFGLTTTYTNGSFNSNGDDNYQLKKNGVTIDVLGTTGTDGSGLGWEFLDGWVYRVDNTVPSTTFMDADWTNGVNVFDGAATNADSDSPMPIGTFTTTYDAGEEGVHQVVIDGITFSPSDLTIYVGDSVVWSNSTGVAHNVNGSTATFPDNPESFFSGVASDMAWTYGHKFSTVGAYSYQCDPHSGAGMTGTITVLDTVPPVVVIPFYPIATITTVDADGVVDSIDVHCYTEGVVHGVDLNGGFPSEFYFIDANGDGMGVYFGNSNYTVAEGDMIKVYGKVGQYKGLQQMLPDSVVVVSTGNALATPTVVTALSEATESKLVRLNGMTLVNPANWPTSGTVSLDITNGVDTFEMRIDGDTDIPDQNIPVGTFDVIGIGNQFDDSSPLTEGYRLLPRYYTDIIASTTEEPAPIPFRAIGDIDNIDANGVGDSIDLECYTTGIVYGVNLNTGSSALFTIIDASGDGIAVYFSNSTYTVVEGDEVQVYGTVSQYNGLMQLLADSVMLVSSSNTLMTETVVTTLGENTESNLVRMNGMTIVDATEWPIDGENANVQITDGVDTFIMRIDKETNSDGMAVPTGTIDVIGIGGQFDNASPYDSAYQIIPRYYADIIMSNTGIEHLFAQDLEVYPNPVENRLNVITEENIEFFQIYNEIGQLIKKDSFTGSSIELSDLPKGIYQLRLSSNNGQRTVTLIKR